jgi:chemotaxis protein methyltransferase WspC
MVGDERFFHYLRDRIGLDVASVGAPMIERAVQQRCAASASASLHAYWQLLNQSATEQQALIEAVIVPETWFFRYPESFVALAGLARKRVMDLKGARPLRLLSLPCSTGEEPYSIAMSLLDAGLCPQQFQVEGVDISPLSIARAMSAHYGRNSFRGADLAFRERHFTATAGGYQLDPLVCGQVRLQAGNILDPQLLRAEQPYDFVFCRNLLIYFDVPTQQRVFDVLKGLTGEEGALFIGPAEGSLLARMGMRPIGIAQSFAFVRAEPPRVRPAAARMPVSSVNGRPGPFAGKPGVYKGRDGMEGGAGPFATKPGAYKGGDGMEGGTGFIAAKPGTYRGRGVGAEPAREGGLPAPTVPQHDDAIALLARITALANEGNTHMAREACTQYLRAHAPSAQVFYWLGLLSDVGGNTLEAQGFYRKALYLQPQHPEALAHLAMLLAAQGDAAGARRLQDRAARNDRAGRGEEKP